MTQKRKTLILLAFLVITAALCVYAYALLRAAGSRHASVWYLVLLYGIVLPAAILYLRSDRDGAQKLEISWPNLHVPAIAIFAILAVFLSHADEHGKLISDESAYMFQARVFAAGELKARPMPGAKTAANPHEVPPEIYFEQTVQSPAGWFAKYPPGWPLVLAVGYLIHLPWVVNPVLGLAQLAIAWWIAGLWGRNTQILTILIAATSSFMLASSVGYMAHAVEGTLSILALGSLLKGIDEKKLSRIALCFMLIVAATQVRPYTGAMLGLLCAGICLYEYRNDFPFLVRAALVAGFAGAMSVALLLSTNWLYTGHPMLSPYAFARGTQHVQEITFSPSLILNNILHTTRWGITETLHFTFPFMILLAAFACITEHKRQRLLVYGALFFPLLVFAYMLQTEGSASIDGERYYFEGFCAFAIVAARGYELLAERWRVRARAAFATMMVMLGLQAASLFFTVKDIESLLAPYRKAYALAHSEPLMPLVFVSGNLPEFTSKHVNWNDAAWWKAPTIYLNDPGPGHRSQVACRFGRPSYRLVEYLPESKAFVKDDVLDVCSEPQPTNTHN